MKILLPSQRRLSWIPLPGWIAGLEWYLQPVNLKNPHPLPPEAKILHLGDLRRPYVGILTELLERRFQELHRFLTHNPHITGVVIHAETALGWKNGEKGNRQEFWQLLAADFSGKVSVFIENNVLLNKDPRYNFIRDPRKLSVEIEEAKLSLALDTSHAAWFYQGWSQELKLLLKSGSGNFRVSHLHLSDWSPGRQGEGRHHLVPGTGVLPINEILKHYQGDQLTLEIKPHLFQIPAYLLFLLRGSLNFT